MVNRLCHLILSFLVSVNVGIPMSSSNGSPDGGLFYLNPRSRFGLVVNNLIHSNLLINNLFTTNISTVIYICNVIFEVD